MASVIGLLGQLQDGTATAEEVAPEIARICHETAREAADELDGMSRKDAIFGRMAGSVPERDDIDTFSEVEAAYIAGWITQQQYAVLHRAVTEAP